MFWFQTRALDMPSDLQMVKLKALIPYVSMLLRMKDYSKQKKDIHSTFMSLCIKHILVCSFFLPKIKIFYSFLGQSRFLICSFCTFSLTNGYSQDIVHHPTCT